MIRVLLTLVWLYAVVCLVVVATVFTADALCRIWDGCCFVWAAVQEKRRNERIWTGVQRAVSLDEKAKAARRQHIQSRTEIFRGSQACAMCEGTGRTNIVEHV